MVKVVSPDAPHKQKLGGVKVVYKDLEFVRWTVREMRARFESRGQRVEGVLLVEFVRYAPALGNETLLGFRESDAFGPVLSFSKGGEDAEHFATHFSPPNLVLLPVDREWASALLASTHIHKKYLAEGRQEHIDRIVDAEVRLSGLAAHFSSFFQPPGAGSFVLSEFEVNPFVFDEHGQFIALDGYATFRERPPEPVDLRLQPKETLRPLFEPHGVAIVGVSASDHGKSGNIILRNLLDLGREDVHCVNRRGGAVEERGRSFPLARSPGRGAGARGPGRHHGAGRVHRAGGRGLRAQGRSRPSC